MADPKTSDYQWDTETFEEFYFLMHGWDVRAAKAIIAKRAQSKKPHVVDFMLVEDVAGFSALIGHQENAEVLKDPDLSIPIIIVHTPQGHLIPIDGWRRIRKARKEGVKTLLCVVLTKTESKRVKIR